MESEVNVNEGSDGESPETESAPVHRFVRQLESAEAVAHRFGVPVSLIRGSGAPDLSKGDE